MAAVAVAVEGTRVWVPVLVLGRILGPILTLTLIPGPAPILTRALTTGLAGVGAVGGYGGAAMRRLATTTPRRGTSQPATSAATTEAGNNAYWRVPTTTGATPSATLVG